MAYRPIYQKSNKMMLKVVCKPENQRWKNINVIVRI